MAILDMFVLPQQYVTCLTAPEEHTKDSAQVFDDFRMNLLRLMAFEVPLAASRSRIRSFVPETAFDHVTNDTWPGIRSKEQA